jgi:hypothetical protein
VARFFNAAVSSTMETASPLVAAAMRADMALAQQPGPEAGRAWCGRLLAALEALDPGTPQIPSRLRQRAADLQPLPIPAVEGYVDLAYRRQWCTDQPGTVQPGTQPRDQRLPEEEQPGRAAYNRWFRPTAGVVMRESAKHTSTSANKRTHANLRMRLGCVEVQPCPHCGAAGDGEAPAADALHACFQRLWVEQQLAERGLPGRPQEAGDFAALYSARPRGAAFRYVQAVMRMLPGWA